MFIVANRNMILPSQDGSQSFRLKRGFMGNIPDWAAGTGYFSALVKDGKITVPKSRKDKDVRSSKKPKGGPDGKGAPPSEDSPKDAPPQPGPEDQ